MSEHLSIILALLGVTLALSSWIIRATEKAKLRAHVLTGVRSAMDESFQLAERALNDPALPQVFRDVLIGQAVVLSNEEQRRAALEGLDTPDNENKSQQRGTSFDELDVEYERLKRERPDLAEWFEDSTSAGYFAALMLHANNIHVFVDIAQRLARQRTHAPGWLNRLLPRENQDKSGPGTGSERPIPA